MMWREELLISRCATSWSFHSATSTPRLVVLHVRMGWRHYALRVSVSVECEGVLHRNLGVTVVMDGVHRYTGRRRVLRWGHVSTAAAAGAVVERVSVAEGRITVINC